MKLTFFKASELESNVKATVHLNGRLGFNKNAEKRLDLENVKSVKIAKSEDYEKDKTLYLLTQEDTDNDGFSVLKAGEYYYATTKTLFDALAEDYEKTKIIYDISEVEYEGEKIFRLKRRDIERKKNEKEDME